MQTKKTLQKFIDEMKFNDWDFHLRFTNDVPYLQIRFTERNERVGLPEVAVKLSHV